MGLDKLTVLLDSETYRNLLATLYLMLWSLAGGACDYLITLNHQSRLFNFKEFVQKLFIAGFAGTLAMTSCNVLHIDHDLEGFIIGIAGMCGESFLIYAKGILFVKIKQTTGVSYADAIHAMEDKDDSIITSEQETN
jgi:hypothetical protein